MSSPRRSASTGFFLCTPTLSWTARSLLYSSASSTESGPTQPLAPGLLEQPSAHRCRGSRTRMHYRHHCRSMSKHRAIYWPAMLALTSILQQSNTNAMFRVLIRP
ncbi:hypothetical protein BD311DRAFT_769304 [Dichomitus squalens]|uniref:Uncharacterized protein n=1 Tax=Dichomitus squalens TaxID=114155 RepID=A0A4Q9MAU8_9APHY|nr:hypothetical protein BD311DRAFT_769304 [Dichomitus squalens]